MEKKNKKPLKVGDRVAVYGSPMNGVTQFGRKTGEVTYLGELVKFLNVRLDGESGEHSFHVAQCRRLIKSKSQRMKAFAPLGQIKEFMSGNQRVVMDVTPQKLIYTDTEIAIILPMVA